MTNCTSIIIRNGSSLSTPQSAQRAHRIILPKTGNYISSQNPTKQKKTSQHKKLGVSHKTQKSTPSTQHQNPRPKIKIQPLHFRFSLLGVRTKRGGERGGGRSKVHSMPTTQPPHNPLDSALLLSAPLAIPPRRLCRPRFLFASILPLRRRHHQRPHPRKD